MLANKMLEHAPRFGEENSSNVICEGVSVTIRPVQSEDLPLIQEMHQRLSPNSLYFRYLALSIPSAQDLEFQCSLNGGPGWQL